VDDTAAPTDATGVADGAADPDLRASDGRVPGRRGRATRQRLLERTAEMLKTTSYRDLKVIDIAREAGTSPATFYQYFADVEAAILVLAEDMAVDADALVRIVAEGTWKGRAGYETALELGDAFIGFWDQHRPVLRVVELTTTEGDRRFREIRVRLLNAVTVELAKVTEALQADGKNTGVDALANAGVIVTMLANVAAHHAGFQAWSMPITEVRTAMARHVYWGVTGQKPPSPT